MLRNNRKERLDMSELFKERLEKMSQIIAKANSEGRILNIVLNHIDPDAMGSGYGLRHFLRHSGVPNARIRVLFTGEAGAEQNRIIIDRYSLMTHMLPLEKFWPSSGKDSYDNSNDVYLLIDSSSPDDRRLLAAAGKIQPIIIIDHHSNPAPEETAESFVWIEHVGACSTMVVNLLTRAGMFDFSKEAGDDVFVPVLLALGIRSDTHDLVANVTIEDLTAYTAVSKLANQADLKALIRIPKSKSRVAVEDYARAHRYQSGLRLVSCAGYIGSNYVYLAEIANDMLDWQGVSVVVVFGLTSECQIVFSIRSTDITLHSPLNQTLRREFGNGCGVKRSEDGLLLEGGGQINIGMNLANNWENREKFLEVIFTHMQNIFLSDELRLQ